MTTIVLDSNLVMAGDSRMALGNHHVGDYAEKVFRIQDWTVGVAGAYSECLAFLDMIEEQIERARVQETTFLPIPESVVEDMENFSAIVVNPAGDVFVFETSRFSVPTQAPVCIGSGSDYAYGALAMGATAEQAVQVASQYDLYTGGGIKVIDCKSSPENCALTREKLAKLSKKEILNELFGEEEISE